MEFVLIQTYGTGYFTFNALVAYFAGFDSFSEVIPIVFEKGLTIEGKQPTYAARSIWGMITSGEWQLRIGVTQSQAVEFDSFRHSIKHRTDFDSISETLEQTGDLQAWIDNRHCLDSQLKDRYYAHNATKTHQGGS